MSPGRTAAVSLVLALAPLGGPANADARSGLPIDDPLFQTIEALDRAVFDAFNGCELEKLGAYFAEDLEFYHDQTGLARSRQSLIDAVRNNICGKVTRELVPGTLEV
jgi:Domain of unknown function (DUF4440)